MKKDEEALEYFDKLLKLRSDNVYYYIYKGMIKFLKLSQKFNLIEIILIGKIIFRYCKNDKSRKLLFEGIRK